MRIYLDIDGTLVQKNGVPAFFLEEFVAYVTKHHDCYWLTTHCRDGDATHTLAYLRRLKVPDETIERMTKIRPTVWDVLKTEAIDMAQPFVWLDDDPMISELAALESAGKTSAFRHINLRDDPLTLQTILRELR